MSDELQTLWQSQTVDPVVLAPLSGRIKGSGIAMPTSHFAGATDHRPRGGRFVPFALAAVLVASFGWWLTRPMVLVVKPPAPRPAPSVDLDPAEEIEIENLLAQCRTYSSSESGAPDFERAEFACRGAMALEPLNHEATTVLARISKLRTCEHHWTRVAELASARPDEAIDEAALITNDCELYFARANIFARDALPVAIKRAQSACKGNLGPGCERWVNLECQRTGLTDQRVSAWSAAHPEWSCPGWVSLRAPVALPDPRDDARAELRKRFTDPAVGEVLVTYFNGDLDSAVARAETLSSPDALAVKEELRLAKRLMLEFGGAVRSGSVPEVVRAARVGKELLEADARLVLGPDVASLAPDDRRRVLQQFESSVRRSVTRALATDAYEQGKKMADRKDFREACRLWKLGSEFSRSDLDLLKALTNICTRKAAAAFDDAKTCEHFEFALDLAVDGDGYREKIEAELERFGCR